MSDINKLQEELDKAGSSVKRRRFSYLEEDSFINQTPKPDAVNKLLGEIDPIIDGTFSDQNFGVISNVWNLLDSLGVEWKLTKTFRGDDDSDRNNNFKRTWEFAIFHVNAKGKDSKINGTLVAEGTGPSSNPMSSYVIDVFLI